MPLADDMHSAFSTTLGRTWRRSLANSTDASLATQVHQATMNTLHAKSSGGGCRSLTTSRSASMESSDHEGPGGGFEGRGSPLSSRPPRRVRGVTRIGRRFRPTPESLWIGDEHLGVQVQGGGQSPDRTHPRRWAVRSLDPGHGHPGDACRLGELLLGQEAPDALSADTVTQRWASWLARAELFDRCMIQLRGMIDMGMIQMRSRVGSGIKATWGT